MASENKIVNFKLDKETIRRLMGAKSIMLDCKMNEAPELVVPEARIKLDIDKKAPTTATYFNNKSTNLHFYGNTVSATANIRKVLTEVDKKRVKSNEREKTARGIESLDIPSIPNTATSPVMSSPPAPTKSNNTTAKSTLKKPVNNSTPNNNINNSTIKNTSKKSKSTANSTPNNNNIPRTPQTNTPRPSYAPNEKLNDRVLQLLALKPYQVSTLAKLLDCTQWDVKKIVDDVGVLLPDPSQKKKKYCLKPNYYKKIRIWDWTAYTNEERLTVLENTKEAYQLLHIPNDSPERNNLIDPNSTTVSHKLIQPPPGKVQITTERERAIAAKKSSNNKKKEAELLSKKEFAKEDMIKTESTLRKPTEKRTSPDLKGKGKTTPSGFSYATTPEPLAPTPSSKLSPSPAATGNKLKPSTQQQLQRPQTHLKLSSSNKKVGSKGLPQPPVEKLSPIKRKPDQAAITPPPSVQSSSGTTNHTTPTTSSKRLKPSDTPHDSSIVELSQIASQPMFDKYCAKFISSQKEYQHTKTSFKSKFPQYIRVLESTKPPTTGSKRSYFDMKLEYYDLVKENYLKTEDESSWEEAESQLRNCNEKRRRLNFMWSSIEKNMNEHHYKLNY